MTLAEKLPAVRGRLSPAFDLSSISWMRVGGPAEILFQPADVDDLSAFLQACPTDIPIFTVGVCSNLIIRDGGIPGVVIRLGRGFNGIDISAQRVVAGAAALDAQVAKRAAASGIDLTFLRTIPGAMGGAVTMNAGCYGREIRDVVKEVAGVARDGNMLRLTAAECGFSYRSSGLPEGFVITEVTLEGAKADPAELEALMHDQLAKRDASQPTKARTCGSTFRNPAGFSSTGRADDVHDLKAWKLIEGAGCRGLRVGGAQMSEMHANFMLNTGSATARDLESLGEEVRKRVFQTSGHSLEWEVKRVGENTTF